MTQTVLHLFRQTVLDTIDGIWLSLRYTGTGASPQSVQEVIKCTGSHIVLQSKKFLKKLAKTVDKMYKQHIY